MKLLLSGLSALLLCTAAQAQYPMPCMPRMAPDACGQGYYVVNCYGQTYGPNYWLRPAGMPFNGMLPPTPWANQAPPSPAFPTHPYARSPRDYWMLSDIEDDLNRRYR
jgi:hypothetical protein